ncbi:unnamed protein product [Laminaria digitata]
MASFSLPGVGHGAAVPGVVINSSTDPLPPIAKRKNLTTPERRAVISELLTGSNKGTLARGDLTRVAQMFDTNRSTIAKLWKEYGKQKSNGVVDPDLSSRRKGNSGHKGIDLEHFREALAQIPMKNRTSQRALAAALGMPRSTLFNNLEKLGLKFPVRRGKVSKKAAAAMGSAAASPAAAAAIAATTGHHHAPGVSCVPPNLSVQQGIAYVPGPHAQGHL